MSTILYPVDTHTHTTFSCHAFATHTEMARAAFEKGLTLICCTDHGPLMPGCDHPWYFPSIAFTIPRRLEGVWFLPGCEANITDDKGSMDVGENERKHLEYCLAGFHMPLFKAGDVAYNTRAALAALDQPYIDALSHPDNPQFPLDEEQLIKAMRDHGAFLELNDHSFVARKGSDVAARRLLCLAAEYGVSVTLASDAHFTHRVGCFERVLELIDEMQFPLELILNRSAETFIAALRKRGKCAHLEGI